MSTYERVAELPVEIESWSMEGLAIRPSPDFERLTTVIRIEGAGQTGLGEDITYEALDQIALQDAGPTHDLTGAKTVGELCDLIGTLDLFPTAPERDVSRLYRRWAFESAALDLALWQAGTSLAGYLGRELQPLNHTQPSKREGTYGAGAPVPRRARATDPSRVPPGPTRTVSTVQEERRSGRLT